MRALPSLQCWLTPRNIVRLLSAKHNRTYSSRLAVCVPSLAAAPPFRGLALFVGIVTAPLPIRLASAENRSPPPANSRCTSAAHTRSNTLPLVHPDTYHDGERQCLRIGANRLPSGAGTLEHDRNQQQTPETWRRTRRRSCWFPQQ